MSVLDMPGEAPLVSFRTDDEVVPMVARLQIPEQLLRAARRDQDAALAPAVAGVPDRRCQGALARVAQV